MVKRLAVLVVLTVIAVTLCIQAARAEDPVTRQDVDACEPDIHRLCEAYFPDEKRVAGCLIEKRSQLSVACAEALARPRDPVESGQLEDDKADAGKTETSKTTTTGKTDADKVEAEKK